MTFEEIFSGMGRYFDIADTWISAQHWYYVVPVSILIFYIVMRIIFWWRR